MSGSKSVQIFFNWFTISSVDTTYFTFLASCLFTTSIHWPCYCTVHVYLVIHFCDSMWSFWVAANLWRFFLLFVYICIVIGDPIIKRESDWIPLISPALPHFCICPKPLPGFPRSYIMAFFLFIELR